MNDKDLNQYLVSTSVFRNKEWTTITNDLIKRGINPDYILLSYSYASANVKEYLTSIGVDYIEHIVARKDRRAHAPRTIIIQNQESISFMKLLHSGIKCFKYKDFCDMKIHNKNACGYVYGSYKGAEEPYSAFFVGIGSKK